MVIPVLCLVCLCMLVWVMLLKAEIARLTLKLEASGDLTRPSKSASQRGMRKFQID